MIYVLFGALAIIGIAMMLSILLAKGLRQQTQGSAHADASDPWTELADDFFGEDQVRRMDEEYGPEFKMALLNDILWEDVDRSG